MGNSKVTLESVTILGKQQFVGKVIAADGTVLYEVRRWSEGGVKSALTSYLLDSRKPLVVQPVVRTGLDESGNLAVVEYVEIDEAASNVFEGTRVTVVGE